MVTGTRKVAYLAVKSLDCLTNGNRCTALIFYMTEVNGVLGKGEFQMRLLSVYKFSVSMPHVSYKVIAIRRPA